MLRSTLFTCLIAVNGSALAFGDFFNGVLQDVAREAATSTAKSVAKQQGVEGADQMIDGAANMHRNGVTNIPQGGNAGIAAFAAGDMARANAQANTPIPQAQLQQYPVSTTDLNGDGIVTYGEVTQVQQRGLPTTANQRWANNNMGYMQNTPAGQAAMNNAGQAVQQQSGSVGSNIGNALGGMIGGFLGGGNNTDSGNDNN